MSKKIKKIVKLFSLSDFQVYWVRILVRRLATSKCDAWLGVHSSLPPFSLAEEIGNLTYQSWLIRTREISMRKNIFRLKFQIYKKKIQKIFLTFHVPIDSQLAPHKSIWNIKKEREFNSLLLFRLLRCVGGRFWQMNHDELLCLVLLAMFHRIPADVDIFWANCQLEDFSRNV